MQLSALQHRRPPPGFANHTPRRWEVTAVCPSQSLPYSDDMFGLGPAAGPPHAEASTKDPGWSATAFETKSEKLRKASSSAILRQDSIEQTFEDSRCTSPATTDYTPALSRADSWSMHYDCTNSAPYSTARSLPSSLDVDRMNTQTSIARLPKDNPSHDLAWFLKNTAPPAPHRKPSKADQPRRAVSGKNALRLFRNGSHQQRRPRASLIQSAHDRLNGILRDEGGLLPGIVEVPKNCQQKISSTGKRYLALVPEQPEQDEDGDTTMSCGEPSILSPDILESRVSVCFHDDVASATGDILDNWLASYADTLSKRQTNSISDLHTVMSDRSSKPPSSFQDVASRLSRQHQYSDTPIRPAASNPPTPIPESALSVSESYQSSVFDRPPPKLSFDTSRALTSHPISPTQEETRAQTPRLSLPHEAFPVKHPSPGKEVQIRHPVPRRFGSHPVLLQRASSIASMMYQRSVSEHRTSCESPGPPPPRSPLRLRRDPRTIEGIISDHENTRRSTPRVAPSIKSVSDFHFDTEPIRATVTTECSGPIKRPKSRGKKDKSVLPGVPYPSNRREREDRARARKLRDKSSTSRTIDSVVNEPEATPRQRLKKLRPRIQIPALTPHRATSAASRHSDVSSAASYKKITQSTLSPVSPMPSLASEISEEEHVGYTPISPTASAEARDAQARLHMSPRMFVAEEAPVRKATKSPKPVRLVAKDAKNANKSYKPRPRSASLPRNALRRRSRQSMRSNQSSPRNLSPGVMVSADDAPPLPSPPPQRALPPTPPQSGSEKQVTSNTGAKRCTQSKELCSIPSYDVSPISTSSSSRKQQQYPHIATQRKGSGERKMKGVDRAASRIDARLEALEKQNALLSAALMAVLKTNGQLNGPLPDLGLVLPEPPPKGPMAWETRVARRSEATMASSHTASSSNGSALEMYMSTRRGSRRGERFRDPALKREG